MMRSVVCFSSIVIMAAMTCASGQSYKEALLKIKKIVDASLGQNKSCGSGWMRFEDHCYHLSPDKQTWYQSEEYCKQLQSYLVKVDDINENNWIVSKLPNTGGSHVLWLGGNDFEQDNQWVWSVDSSKFSFQKWGTDEPNGEKRENCLEVVGKGYPNYGKWNDIDCNMKMFAMCEKEMI